VYQNNIIITNYTKHKDELRELLRDTHLKCGANIKSRLTVENKS